MKDTIEKSTNTTTEKPYSFRKLSTADIFPTLKLINKLGLKQLKEDEGIKRLVSQISGATTKGKIDPTALGLDIFLELTCLVVDNLPKCEVELYDLLSSTSGMTVEEIKALEMSVFVEMITDFIKKEEFGDFFKAVTKLFK